MGKTCVGGWSIGKISCNHAMNMHHTGLMILSASHSGIPNKPYSHQTVRINTFFISTVGNNWHHKGWLSTATPAAAPMFNAGRRPDLGECLVAWKQSSICSGLGLFFWRKPSLKIWQFVIWMCTEWSSYHFIELICYTKDSDITSKAEKAQKRRKFDSEVTWDEERAELSEMVAFVSQSSVIYAWKWKRQREKNHTQGPCLISMATWRLLSYLAIHYQRTCVDGKWDIVGRKDGVLQKRTDWMHRTKLNGWVYFPVVNSQAETVNWTGARQRTCTIWLWISSPPDQ